MQTLTTILVKPIVDLSDEADVRQIVWSLGTNGLRAMPDGGRLVLSARGEEVEQTLQVEPGGWSALNLTVLR